MNDTRQTEYPIDSVFIERWSARSFTSETMPEADLLSMLEAARWSQSASNLQPWRFSYALRGEADWDKYLGFLVEFNQMWAGEAAALVVAVSVTESPSVDGAAPKPITTHSLDTGAAMQSLTLQATKLGYIAHAMAGILPDKISQGLDIPATGFKVEAAIAIGKLGPKEKLHERLREREVQSLRKPLSEIAFKGKFEA